MTVIARRFAASPVRVAGDVWDAIVNALTSDSVVKTELNKVKSFASSVIADQTPEQSAITVIGAGPRLRIYCIYGEDAIGDDVSEDSSNWNIFSSGDWQIHFPVPKEELEWARKTLKGISSKFEAYEAGEAISDTRAESNSAAPLSINIQKLKNYG